MAARAFVVEADGGSRGNPGPAGYGAVVRDAASGEVLAETAEYLGTCTNNVAEYRGLIAGLRAAHAVDPAARITVRMDSKLVVEQMSGRWKIKHPDMRPLAAEARTVFPAGQVSYEWIPREKNKHADRLANEAMDAGKKGRSWQPRQSAAAPAGPGPARGGQPAPGRVADPGPGRVAEPAAGRVADPGPGQVTDPAAGQVTEPRLGRVTEPRPGQVSEPVPEPVPEAAPAHVSGPAAEAAAPAVGWGGEPGTPAPTTFVLLRHGETPLTPMKRFSGSGGTDPDLSDKGRWQAARIADTLAARGTVQAIVSSPLARCRRTADTVAARLGLGVRVDEGLRETDFGAWEGLTFAEVRERFPAELDAWLASPKTAPPGGESFATVTRRVALARDKLLARYAGRTVLLVTHVTPIKVLARLALGAPPEALFRMELSAASLSAVAYYADGNTSLRLLNDTSHLR